MKNPLVQCAACRSRGVVEVTGLYAETWRFLVKQKRPVNGAQLARLMSINPTAMNNRLVWLEAHGLAVSERNGKERLWLASDGNVKQRS